MKTTDEMLIEFIKDIQNAVSSTNVFYTLKYKIANELIKVIYPNINDEFLKLQINNLLNKKKDTPRKPAKSMTLAAGTEIDDKNLLSEDKVKSQFNIKNLNSFEFKTLTNDDKEELERLFKKPENFYLRVGNKAKETTKKTKELINKVTDKIFISENFNKFLNSKTIKEVFDKIIYKYTIIIDESEEFKKLFEDNIKLKESYISEIKGSTSEKLASFSLYNKNNLKFILAKPNTFPDLTILPLEKKEEEFKKFLEKYNLPTNSKKVFAEVKSGKKSSKVNTSKIGVGNVKKFIFGNEEILEGKKKNLSDIEFKKLLGFLYPSVKNEIEEIPLIFVDFRNETILSVQIPQNISIEIKENENNKEIIFYSKGIDFFKINLKEAKEEPKETIKEVPKPEEQSINLEGRLKQAVDFINKNRIPYRKSDFLEYLFEPNKKLIPVSILDLEKKIRKIVDLKSLRNETLKLQNREEIKNFLKDKKYLREWKLKERKVKNLFENALSDIKEKNRWS
jgi:hypothetical protein